MTCASCEVHIEKVLNRLPGVAAAVNYATENAAVDFDPVKTTTHGPGAARIRGERRGPVGPGRVATAPARVRRARGSRLLLSMIPALQFDGWAWVAIALATPVATWGASPFRRAAWTNLRRGTATMDTPISMGVIAA
jgi:Cu+-exporting ATPase